MAKKKPVSEPAPLAAAAYKAMETFLFGESPLWEHLAEQNLKGGTNVSHEIYGGMTYQQWIEKTQAGMTGAEHTANKKVALEMLGSVTYTHEEYEKIYGKVALQKVLDDGKKNGILITSETVYTFDDLPNSEKEDCASWLESCLKSLKTPFGGVWYFNSPSLGQQIRTDSQEIAKYRTSQMNNWSFTNQGDKPLTTAEYWDKQYNAKTQEEYKATMESYYNHKTQLPLTPFDRQFLSDTGISVDSAVVESVLSTVVGHTHTGYLFNAGV